MPCIIHHLQHYPKHSPLSAGEMYGQTRAEAGLKDRDVLRQLRGAIHRHQPVHPQQTGTDPKEPGLVLRDDGRLSAVPGATGMAQACGWCSVAKPFSPESWPHDAEPEKGTSCLLQVPNTGLTPCADSCGQDAGGISWSFVSNILSLLNPCQTIN